MWEEHHHYAGEIVDPGPGVQHAVVREDRRMKDGDAQVEARNAWVTIWDDGKVCAADHVHRHRRGPRVP
jgi:hypothetical protein